MRTTWLSILACTVLFCVGARPRLHGPGKPPPPPPLQPIMVGPTQTITRPCDAIAVALAGQEIDIAPGTYTDSCEITTEGLWLRGVGGQPKIDLSGTNHPADYKGIYVVASDNVTIENLELTGAHIDDSEGGNAAALRVTGQGRHRPRLLHPRQPERRARGPARRRGQHHHREHGALAQRARRCVRSGRLRAQRVHQQDQRDGPLRQDDLPVQLEPRPRERHRRQGAPAEVALARDATSSTTASRARWATTATRSTSPTAASAW